MLRRASTSGCLGFLAGKTFNTCHQILIAEAQGDHFIPTETLSLLPLHLCIICLACWSLQAALLVIWKMYSTALPPRTDQVVGV